jgi:phosphate starvation-inducible PhoH-like protein
MNGDIRQSDIKEQSGLSKAIHLAKKYNIDAAIIEFGIDDVVRSDICKQWLIAFYEEGI